MKYIFSFCLLLSLSNKNFAQILRGTVTDPGGRPVENIIITAKTDSSNSVYQVTNAAGAFRFANLKSGKYYKVDFSSLGYKTRDTTIFMTNGITLQVVMLRDSQQLKEVNVTGHKNILERKIDRLVFNVENNINTTGLDGIDLLNKTPLVRVDGDNITLVGKQGLAVMIDGRLTHLDGQALTNMLRAMNADNISKIEVITNPPAQYDATGNSGMINIVTKKLKAPGYAMSVAERINIDHYFTSAPNVNVNYNKGKFLMFGGLGISNGANGPTSGQSRYYQQQTWNSTDSLKEISKYTIGNIGFEYLMNKSTTIGASYNATYSYPNVQMATVTSIQNNDSRTIDSVLHADIFSKKNFNSGAFNFHILQKIDSLGKALQFDVDYFKNTTNIDNNSFNYHRLPDAALTLYPENNVLSFNDLTSRGYTINAEVDLPFKKYTFKFGGKASFISSDSHITFSQLFHTSKLKDSTSVDDFNYGENIQALFASFDGGFGKFKLQAGLRGEATQTKGFSNVYNQVNKRSYYSLFPTIYLTYELSKTDILSLNAGRRISRPIFSSVDPFRSYQDSYNYSVGNPDLRPSFTNNFELSNTFNNILNTTLSYGVTYGGTTGVELISNDSNIQVTTVGNFLTSKNLLLDNSVSFQLFSWLESTDELSLYRSSTKSSSFNTPGSSTGWGADFSTSNTISLNKLQTVKAGVDFAYQFPFIADLIHYKRYSDVDLTGSALLFNKTLQLTVSVRDIFKTKLVSMYTTYNNIGYLSFANNDSHRLVLNIKYAFGNSKLSKGRSHSESSDERSRSSH